MSFPHIDQLCPTHLAGLRYSFALVRSLVPVLRYSCAPPVPDAAGLFVLTVRPSSWMMRAFTLSEAWATSRVGVFCARSHSQWECPVFGTSTAQYLQMVHRRMQVPGDRPAAACLRRHTTNDPKPVDATRSSTWMPRARVLAATFVGCAW